MSLLYILHIDDGGDSDEDDGPDSFNCDDRNPCTQENIDAGKFYFPNDDATKFVQCDQWGGCFIMPCGPGTVWDPVAYTCNTGWEISKLT